MLTGLGKEEDCSLKAFNEIITNIFAQKIN